jgi:hypothetical protein
LAALFGRSAFCDLRDGVGGTSIASLSDQDVAAALGIVMRREGKLAALVLETYYASTMAHAARLRREWEDRERRDGDTRERLVLTRFGGELAIRALAGIKYTTTDYAEYAYLICSRREALQDRVHEATSWLTDIRERALRELRSAVREPRIAA